MSFLSTTPFWRIYIYQAGELLPAAIAAAPDPDRLARSAAVTHPIMLAGIVATAVGDELVITHPLEHTRAAWVAVILGGPALFLAGRAAFEYAVLARVFWDRPTGVLVLAALTPPKLFVPPLLAAVAAVAVLIGVAITDGARVKPASDFVNFRRGDAG